MRRAVRWLAERQNADGGWGESNDTYAQTRGAANCAEYFIPECLGASGTDGSRGGAIGCRGTRYRLPASEPRTRAGSGVTRASRRLAFRGCSISSTTDTAPIFPSGRSRRIEVSRAPEALIDDQGRRHRLCTARRGASSGSNSATTCLSHLSRRRNTCGDCRSGLHGRRCGGVQTRRGRRERSRELGNGGGAGSGSGRGQDFPSERNRRHRRGEYQHRARLARAAERGTDSLSSADRRKTSDELPIDCVGGR